MIKAMAHVCLSAKDLDEAEKFYCSGLGLSKKFNFVRDGKVFGYYLQISPNNYIEIFQTDAISSEDEPRVKHLCLEVDDIDKAIETIRSRGIDIGNKSMGCDNTWQVWMTDPNGIKIELHQYTDKSSQFIGTDCVVTEEW